MKLSLSEEDLKNYIAKQVNNFFPDKFLITSFDVEKILSNALKRTEYCFSNINLKYYGKEKEIYLNHLHSEQYCMFLWFLSNEAYLKNNINLAEKLFYLNKTLNCLDAFYSIKLPDIFMLSHPVGTVLGNASYKNYLLVYQNVTIGASKEYIYPVLGEDVSLYAGSKIIGNCNISDNVTLSAGSCIINEDIPPNTFVFGQSRNLILKQKKDCIKNFTFKKDLTC